MTEIAAGAAKSRYDRSIVDGPLRAAVWNIAWPTMLTNAIGGLQASSITCSSETSSDIRPMPLSG